MHRQWCFVLVARLCCVSPLEAKLASQKGVPSEGSSIKMYSGRFRGESEKKRVSEGGDGADSVTAADSYKVKMGKWL